MSNQKILDEIEFAMPDLPIGLREKILDAVWMVLTDERKDEEEHE